MFMLCTAPACRCLNRAALGRSCMRRTLPVLALLLLAPPHVTAAPIRGRVVGGGKAVAGAKISAYAIETVAQTIVRAVANRPRVALATTTSAANGTFALPID